MSTPGIIRSFRRCFDAPDIVATVWISVLALIFVLVAAEWILLFGKCGGC